jgi:hypothetical protein
MGLLQNLMDKIFHAEGTVKPTPPPVKPTTAAAAATAVLAEVDVAKILDDLAAKNKEKLDWRQSIVDLMKLVGMESSLSARRELADDLKYTGDKNDTATMNIWLHKEVMKKLAANGGKVPAELLSH